MNKREKGGHSTSSSSWRDLSSALSFHTRSAGLHQAVKSSPGHKGNLFVSRPHPEYQKRSGPFRQASLQWPSVPCRRWSISLPLGSIRLLMNSPLHHSSRIHSFENSSAITSFVSLGYRKNGWKGVSAQGSS